eukprot:Rmarinus@m.1710
MDQPIELLTNETSDAVFVAFKDYAVDVQKENIKFLKAIEAELLSTFVATETCDDSEIAAIRNDLLVTDVPTYAVRVPDRRRLRKLLLSLRKHLDYRTDIETERAPAVMEAVQESLNKHLDAVCLKYAEINRSLQTRHDMSIAKCRRAYEKQLDSERLWVKQREVELEQERLVVLRRFDEVLVGTKTLFDLQKEESSIEEERRLARARAEREERLRQGDELILSSGVGTDEENAQKALEGGDIDPFEEDLRKTLLRIARILVENKKLQAASSSEALSEDTLRSVVEAQKQKMTEMLERSKAEWLERLQLQKEEAASDVERVEKNLFASEKDKRALEKQLKLCQEQLSSLEVNLENQTTACRSLTSEKKVLQSRNENLSKDVEALQKKLEKISSQQQASSKSSQREKQAREAEVAAIRKKHADELRKTTEDFQRKLNEAQESGRADVEACQTRMDKVVEAEKKKLWAAYEEIKMLRQKVTDVELKLAEEAERRNVESPEVRQAKRRLLELWRRVRDVNDSAASQIRALLDRHRNDLQRMRQRIENERSDNLNDAEKGNMCDNISRLLEELDEIACDCPADMQQSMGTGESFRNGAGRAKAVVAASKDVMQSDGNESEEQLFGDGKAVEVALGAKQGKKKHKAKKGKRKRAVKKVSARSNGMAEAPLTTTDEETRESGTHVRNSSTTPRVMKGSRRGQTKNILELNETSECTDSENNSEGVLSYKSTQIHNQTRMSHALDAVIEQAFVREHDRMQHLIAVLEDKLRVASAEKATEEEGRLIAENTLAEMQSLSRRHKNLKQAYRGQQAKLIHLLSAVSNLSQCPPDAIFSQGTTLSPTRSSPSPTRGRGTSAHAGTHMPMRSFRNTAPHGTHSDMHAGSMPHPRSARSHGTALANTPPSVDGRAGRTVPHEPESMPRDRRALRGARETKSADVAPDGLQSATDAPSSCLRTTSARYHRRVDSEEAAACRSSSARISMLSATSEGAAGVGAGIRVASAETVTGGGDANSGNSGQRKDLLDASRERSPVGINRIIVQTRNRSPEPSHAIHDRGNVIPQKRIPPLASIWQDVHDAGLEETHVRTPQSNTIDTTVTVRKAFVDEDYTESQERSENRDSRVTHPQQATNDDLEPRGGRRSPHRFAGSRLERIMTGRPLIGSDDALAVTAPPGVSRHVQHRPMKLSKRQWPEPGAAEVLRVSARAPGGSSAIERVLSEGLERSAADVRGRGCVLGSGTGEQPLVREKTASTETSPEKTTGREVPVGPRGRIRPASAGARPSSLTSDGQKAHATSSHGHSSVEDRVFQRSSPPCHTSTGTHAPAGNATVRAALVYGQRSSSSTQWEWARHSDRHPERVVAGFGVRGPSTRVADRLDAVLERGPAVRAANFTAPKDRAHAVQFPQAAAGNRTHGPPSHDHLGIGLVGTCAITASKAPETPTGYAHANTHANANAHSAPRTARSTEPRMVVYRPGNAPSQSEESLDLPRNDPPGRSGSQLPFSTGAGRTG